MRLSFETSIGTALRDPIGRQLLATMDISVIADRLLTDDGYGDGAKMRDAARLVDADLRQWYYHRLWCARREALGDRADPLSLSLLNAAYLDETQGHATVLVAPMSLPMRDALSAVTRLAEGRQVIVFGHDVFAEDVPEPGITVADPARGPVKNQIRAILDRGGIYCTYADFAYADISVQQVALFGRPRMMSAGWLKLAARHGTMLLPMLCRRTTDVDVTIELAEPTRIESPTGTTDISRIAALTSTMLEDRIRLAPAQWLLLPTLAFDSPEMAGAR